MTLRGAIVFSLFNSFLWMLTRSFVTAGLGTLLLWLVLHEIYNRLDG